MGIKFPTPWKTLIIKFPHPQDGKGVKCPGYARGGGGGGEGMLKLRFDQYISGPRNVFVVSACIAYYTDDIKELIKSVWYKVP